MSKHRSSKRATRIRFRTRTKAVVVAVVAISLSAGAYTAHATFGRAHLGSGHTVASGGVTTLPAQTLAADRTSAAGIWPQPTWWPPHPTTTPTTSPTTKPTTKPTTTSPSTTKPTTAPTTTPTTSTPPPTGGTSFPGELSGSFYLGMSCGTLCPEKEKGLGQPYGIHREFSGWGNWNRIAKMIQADNKVGRLPWISFKPPSSTGASWRALAAGTYDSELQQLAAVLKANDSKPLFLTFHHEPSNVGEENAGLWAAAYCHIHDVLAKAGALANVADPPIMNGWLFDQRNPADPGDWLTPAVLKRVPFVGFDFYENSGGATLADQGPAVLAWLKSQGYPKMMVGVGELGATNYYSGTTAVKWLDESLSWAAANPDKVAAISYFNSTANSRAGVYWPLDETPAKLTLFRSWLNSSKTMD